MLRSDWRLWLSRLFSRPGTTARRKAPRRPALEALEGRVVPALVGYVDDRTFGTGNEGYIAASGHTPVRLTDADLATYPLRDLGALVIATGNNARPAALVANFGSVLDYVERGGSLIIHDSNPRANHEGGDVVPGLDSVVFRGLSEAGVSVASNRVNVLDPTSPLVAGPFGTVTDASLDNGNRSAHGYAEASSLPAGVNRVLDTADNRLDASENPQRVAAFNYRYGAGYVSYVAIPAEFFTALGYPGGDGTFSNRLQAIYLRNELAAAIAAPTLADVRVSVAGPASALPGENLTFAITYENDGAGKAAGASLEVTIPTGATFVSFSAPPGWAVTRQPEGSSVPLRVEAAPSIRAADGPQTFALILATDPADRQTRTLLVTAIGYTTTDELTAADNSASAAVNVVTGADLSVSQTAPAGAKAGRAATYVVTVSNVGGTAAHDVVLTDALPPGVTLQSVNFTQGSGTVGRPADGVVALAVGTLAPGATVSANVVVIADEEVTADGATLTNFVFAGTTTPDANAANNASAAASAFGNRADLAAEVTGPATAAPGGLVPYVVTVTNAGDNPAREVSLQFPLPAGSTFVSATQTGGPEFALNAPAVGDTSDFRPTVAVFPGGDVTTATFEIVVKLPTSLTPGTEVTATATAAMNSDVAVDGDAGNDSAFVVTTVAGPVADVRVSQELESDFVTAGREFAIVITVSNAGPSDATDVRLVNTLPGGFEVVSTIATQGSVSVADGILTAELGTVAIGAPAVVTIRARASAGFASGSVVTSDAQVTTSAADPDAGNNVSSATSIYVADAELTLTGGAPATVVPGGTVAYEFALSNAGPSDAREVTFSTAAPAGTTFVSFEQTAGPAFTLSDPSSRVIEATSPQLAAGASATFRLVVRADAATPAGTALVAQAAATSATLDDTPSNNAVSVSVEAANASADVSVSVVAPAVVVPGQTTAYKITVTNAGPSDARGVVVTNLLPFGASVVSLTQPGGEPFATLAAGRSATFSLVVSVPSSAAAVFVVTANVSSANDANPANNAVTSSVPTTPTADPVGLSAAQRFVQALYLAELGRAGTVAELDGWVAVLGDGGRAAVALGVSHSGEARARVVQGWYREYLRRDAQPGEPGQWVDRLASGQSEERVLAAILASPEFYGRAQTPSEGSADERYVKALYVALLGRDADATGLAGALANLPRVGREGVALGILNGEEYRRGAVDGYFASLLRRPGEASAVAEAARASLNLGGVRRAFEASDEFFANG